MPRGPVFDKVLSNLEEIKARGGPVIAVATEGDDETAARADDAIFIPKVPEYLQPLRGGGAVAVAGVSHGGAARLRCGQAAQSRQERDGGITTRRKGEHHAYLRV